MRHPSSSLADQSWQGQVELRELRAGQPAPALCAYLLYERGCALALADIAADGRFTLDLPAKGRIGGGPRHVAVGPPPVEGRDLPRAPLQRWRTAGPERELRLRIAPGDWLPWSSQRRELRGRLLWRPFDDALAARLAALASQPGAGTDSTTQALRQCLSRHGYPVREAQVVVYRRWCYSQPPKPDEPRFHELLEQLQATAATLPPADLADSESPRLRRQLAAFVHDGALDLDALLAPCHLAALQAGDADARAAHLAAHPRLHCQPGAVSPVASGEIGSDGRFRIRWHELLQLMPAGCHEEFSLVISQSIAGRSQVIHDGVGAGHWVAASASGQIETMNLVSLHPAARCLPSRPDCVSRGARVRLMSINEQAAGAVLAAPDAGTPPLRGLLMLRYRFEPALRACGAHYYRVRVSDADGQKRDSTTLLAPAWTRHRPGGHPEIIGLGPQTAGAQTGLLRIPYEDEHDWQAGQPHALLDSREFADGRHRITLELFDAQGRRLMPRDTGHPGGHPGDRTATFEFVTATDGAARNEPALTECLHWNNAPQRREYPVESIEGGGAEVDVATRSGMSDGGRISPRAQNSGPRPRRLAAA